MDLLAIIAALAMSPTSDIQEWATAVSRHATEDKAIVYRYASKFSSAFSRGTQPDRIDVIWEYAAPSGMPSPDERERMDELEDLLAPTIEAAGFASLVLVSTGENVRMWMYYAVSQEAFVQKLNVALRGRPVFPIDLTFDRDPNWEAFDAFLSGVVGGDD